MTIMKRSSFALVLLFCTSACSLDEDEFPCSLYGLDSDFALKEGDVLNVCCSKTYEVALTGVDVDVRDDFNNHTGTITPDHNCTAFDTVDDSVYERNKVFTVTLYEEGAGEDQFSNTIILQDDDGGMADIECSTSFVKTRNISEILQKQQYCSLPVEDDLSQCSSTYVLDCTRWNAGLISLLGDPTRSNALFPSIISSSTDQQCMDVISILSSGYTAGGGGVGSGGGCYTNCTATLTSPDRCNVSVFLLEGIPVSSVSDLTSSSRRVQEECGVMSITCCSQDCTFMGTTEQDTAAAPALGAIVGGVVGSALFVAGIVVLAVVVGVVMCVMRRTKKRKEWKRNSSTLVQSIVYKPKKIENSGGASSISQDSMTASTTPLFLENGRTASTDQPNYEEVTFTETYSEWKKKFVKVMIDTKYLEYGDLIGEGEFSKVYKAKYSMTPDSTMQVAVKNLKVVSEKKEIEKFIAESAIMMDFDHFNILRLIGVCFDTRSNLPAIVLPYMAKGDLRTFLRAKRASMISSDAPKDEYPEGLSEAVMIGMCMDIARGMHYLSKCKLVHRDLAARNCMVDDMLRVKVADFGLSRDIHISDYYRLKTQRQKLPVKWMAPESLFQKLYNVKTDVWSYGIVCWEIFKFGKKPFAGIDNPDLPGYINHGFRPKKPSRCPDKLFKLMQVMWSKEPEKRPDFKAIVLSLANLVEYSGDIEKELQMETEDCPKRYQAELTQQKEHMYSVLEGPLQRNNFSRDREESLDFPEEYEVPVPGHDAQSNASSPEVPPESGKDAEYEIPVVPDRDIDSPVRPEEYEVPMVPGRDIDSPVHYEVPDSLPGYPQYEVPDSLPDHPQYEVPDSLQDNPQYEEPVTLSRNIDSPAPPKYESVLPVGNIDDSPDNPEVYEVPVLPGRSDPPLDTSDPVDYETPQAAGERKKRMKKEKVRKERAPSPRLSTEHLATSPSRENATTLNAVSPPPLPRRQISPSRENAGIRGGHGARHRSKSPARENAISNGVQKPRHRSKSPARENAISNGVPSPRHRSKSPARENAISNGTSSPPQRHDRANNRPPASREVVIIHNNNNNSSTTSSQPRLRLDRRSKSPARENAISNGSGSHLTSHSPHHMSPAHHHKSPAQQEIVIPRGGGGGGDVRKVSDRTERCRSLPHQNKHSTSVPITIKASSGGSGGGGGGGSGGAGGGAGAGGGDHEMAFSSPGKRLGKGDAVSPGYLKLNYPTTSAQKSTTSVADSNEVVLDKPYSTLEWRKGKLVGSNSNTLPNRSTVKSHIYQTLEPAQAAASQ